MKRILLIALAMMVAVAASAKNYGWDTEILYKGAPDAYTEKMCRLDVAYEQGGQDRPVIVWFHGGGLTSGWRHIPDALRRGLRQSGRADPDQSGAGGEKAAVYPLSVLPLL